MIKNCAICGKPSGMYPLCKDHFKLKDEGKVKKCETCGTWYLTDEGCPNCKKITPTIPQETTTPKITCLIVGKIPTATTSAVHAMQNTKIEPSIYALRTV